jgi:ribosomal protein L18
METTRERHLLRHFIFQTNEGDLVVASEQKNKIKKEEWKKKCRNTEKNIKYIFDKCNEELT